MSRVRANDASSAASAPTGSRPGVNGVSAHHSASSAMTGTSPARTSEDLPEPEGPTTSSAAPSTCSADDRSNFARSVVSRPRPKKTRRSPMSKGRRPGKGERSSGQPAPPAASMRASASATAARPVVGSPVISADCTAVNRGWSTPASARSGRRRHPRERAMPTSAEHHAEATYAVVTTQTTASAQRRRSCSRCSQSSPMAIPLRRLWSRNTS